MTEHEALIEDYLAGELAEADLPRLQAWLAADERHMQQFIRIAHQHGALRDVLSGEGQLEQLEPATVAPASPGEAKQNWLPRSVYSYFAQPTPLSMTVAALVIGLMLTVMAFTVPPFYRHLAGTNEEDDWTTREFVAQITGGQDAVWVEGQIGVSQGSHLVEGRELELLSGLVEVTFRSGAELVIEGPATFRVDTRNSGHLERGKVAAHVTEEAVGFSLRTNQAEFIDLGTKFGVHVKEETVEASVMEGKIVVRPRAEGKSRVVLQDGEAWSADAGKLAKTDSAGLRESFVWSMPERPATALREKTDQDTPPGDANASSHRGSRLIAFYPFDGNGRIGGGTAADASAVENVRFVNGLEGQAAQFTGEPTSYIDLPIDANPDRLPVMTWGAWVRPSDLSGRHTILTTDNGEFDRMLTIDERSGQAPAGKPQFASHGGPAAGVLRSTNPRLPVVGKWTFVAATYDQPSGTVTLYVEGADGELSQDLFRSANTGQGHGFIRVGAHVSDHSETFSGEIDNVFLIRGRLTATQLKNIQTAGAAAVLRLADEKEQP